MLIWQLFSVGGVVSWIIVALVGVASARAVWLTVTLPRSAPREPVCENCAYSVVGAPSLTCTECGADLRHVGILTRAMEVRRRGGLVGALLGWTMLTLLLGLLIIQVGVNNVASRAAIPATTSPPAWKATASLTPASGAYQSISIESQYSWLRRTDILITLTLTDATQSRMALDTATQKHAVFDPAETTPVLSAEFDADSVSKWFAVNGLDTEDAQVSAESAELTRFLNAASFSPQLIAQPGSLVAFTTTSSAIMQVPASYTPAPAPAWDWRIILVYLAPLAFLALWITGIVLIIYRRHYLLKHYAPRRTRTMSSFTSHSPAPATPPPSAVH